MLCHCGSHEEIFDAFGCFQLSQTGEEEREWAQKLGGHVREDGEEEGEGEEHPDPH